MKKICTVLSSAFFAAAAFAGSTTELAPFTMDPPGGLVESLQTFKMTMQPESGVSELGFNAYSIYIEKNGQRVATASSYKYVLGTSPRQYELAFSQNIVEGGRYTLVMPEGSVSKYDSEGSKTWSNTVQYEYDYTIDAPVREEIPFSLAPAPGSTLPILNALNLDVIPGTEVAGLSFKSNFWKIYKDGEAVYGNFSYKRLDGKENGLTSSFIVSCTPQTADGEYRIEMPAGSVVMYNAENQEIGTNSYAYEFTYTVSFDPAVDAIPGFTNTFFTIDPASGTLDKLDTFNLDLVVPASHADYISWGVKNWYVTKDGVRVCGVNQPVQVDGPEFTVSLETAQTESGVYRLIIPVKSVSDGFSDLSNEEWYIYEYTVEGQTSGGELNDDNYPHFSIDPLEVNQTELTEIKLYPKDKYTDISAKGDMWLNKDGAKFCNIGFDYKFAPDYSRVEYFFLYFKDENGTRIDKITDPGEYTVVIPSKSLEYYSGLGFVDIEDEISIKYIIAGGELNDDNYPYFSIDPLEVNQTELTEIKLYPKDGYTDISAKGEMWLYKNGAKFCNIGFDQTIKPDYSKVEYFYLYFKDEKGTRIDKIADPGEYTVVIPSKSLEYFNGFGFADIEEEISLKYVIEGSSVVPGQGLITFDPAGGEVSELSIIKMFPKDPYTGVDWVGDNQLILTKDGADYCKVRLDWQYTSDFQSLEYTFLYFVNENGTKIEKITDPGEYKITVPAGDFMVYNDSSYENNDSEIVLSYTIAAAAEPTVYDATVSKTSPIKLDQTTDFDDIQWEASQIVTFTTNISSVKVKDNVTVTFASKDGSFSTTAMLEVNFGNQMKAVFTETPSLNGDYTITIPKASFGDEAWLADNTTGHSNDELVLNYTFTGLKDPAQAVEFDIVPVTFKPALDQATGDLSSVTVTFDQALGIYGGGDLAAVLWSTEQNYRVIAYVSASAPQTEFTFEFKPAPTEAGNYLFKVAKGSLGDADYIANDQTGHASAEISHVYEFNPSLVGILTIDADQVFEDGIYTVEGICVGKTTRNLPAGIYIAGGRKIAIK